MSACLSNASWSGPTGLRRRDRRRAASKLPPSARCRLTRCTSRSVCTRSSGRAPSTARAAAAARRAGRPSRRGSACCASSSARSLLAHGARQDRLAVARARTRRQRALDFAECARAELRVLGDRLLLLRGADLDLRLQRAAVEERLQRCRRRGSTTGLSRFLQHEELARDAVTPAVSVMRGSRAAFASSMR